MKELVSQTAVVADATTAVAECATARGRYRSRSRTLARTWHGVTAQALPVHIPFEKTRRSEACRRPGVQESTLRGDPTPPACVPDVMHRHDIHHSDICSF